MQNYKELADIYEPLKQSVGLEVRPPRPLFCGSRPALALSTASGLCETFSQVLAFPCNQFLHQEPGDGAAVCSFAARKGAKWPVFATVDVNGEAESPVYTFLKASAGDWRDVEWNFGKVGLVVPWLCFVVCSSLCLDFVPRLPG